MKTSVQKTVSKEGRLSGIGLHTGQPAVLTLKPAPVDTGLRFSRGGRPVEAVWDHEATRCSAVGKGEERILTVEHFLAALQGLGITNLFIDVDGPEVPGLDGSALDFVRELKKLGVAEQGKIREFYRVREPIFCYDKTKAIAIHPAESFRVSYLLDYDHPELRGQKVDFELTPEAFESQIASARTFCTDLEARELKAKGFGLGADETNTLVVAEDGSHRGGMRFEDEPARHKVLDILGDLGLLGFPVLGHVVAVRSGHALNRELAQKIKAQKESR